MAAFGAFCYALSSVAIAKSSQSAQGRGNDVLLSVLMTGFVSGALWLVWGPELPSVSQPVLIGVAYFVLAGLLFLPLFYLKEFKKSNFLKKALAQGVGGFYLPILMFKAVQMLFPSQVQPTYQPNHLPELHPGFNRLGKDQVHHLWHVDAGVQHVY